MVARLLALVMLAQVLAVLLIWRALDGLLPGRLALLAALAAVLLVRMLIVANNFFLSWRARSATPDSHALDWPARLRLFFTEFTASMRAWSWTMLWYRPQLHLASAPRGLPVLLVHGYGCNGGYWALLRRVLVHEQISHAAVDLEPITASIDDYAAQIGQAAQRLLAATGQERLVVVAHSMGGLAVRAWLRSGGGAEVAKLITLGTPHHGTVLASFGIGENARQMRRGSAWLAALDAGDAARRTGMVSIWSHHDNIIAPQESCRLAGARNIEVGGVGHVALGSDALVLSHVLKEILTIR